MPEDKAAFDGNLGWNARACVRCPVMRLQQLWGGTPEQPPLPTENPPDFRGFTCGVGQAGILRRSDSGACSLRLWLNRGNSSTIGASPARISIPCMRVRSLQAALHINKTIHILH